MLHASCPAVSAGCSAAQCERTSPGGRYTRWSLVVPAASLAARVTLEAALASAPGTSARSCPQVLVLPTPPSPPPAGCRPHHKTVIARLILRCNFLRL